MKKIQGCTPILLSVASYVTLHPAMSVSWSDGWLVGQLVGCLVGWLVGPPFTFLAF